MKSKFFLIFYIIFFNKICFAENLDISAGNISIEEPKALLDESFETGLLEYPLYTQPRIWKGLEVPQVLLSGDHKKINLWKMKMSEMITKSKRPDLWAKYIKS